MGESRNKKTIFFLIFIILLIPLFAENTFVKILDKSKAICNNDR